MKMVTSTNLICFLAMSMMIFDETFGRSTRELRSTSCNNDGDCGETDFCHYKYKKCRRASSGCMLSAQQNGCLGAKLIAPGIEAIACDVATENERTREKCHAGFKAIEQLVKGSCNIAFTQVCNPESCPQNYHHALCKKKNSFKSQWGGK